MARKRRTSRKRTKSKPKQNKKRKRKGGKKKNKKTKKNNADSSTTSSFSTSADITVDLTSADSNLSINKSASLEGGFLREEINDPDVVLLGDVMEEKVPEVREIAMEEKDPEVREIVMEEKELEVKEIIMIEDKKIGNVVAVVGGPPAKVSFMGSLNNSISLLSPNRRKLVSGLTPLFNNVPPDRTEYWDGRVRQMDSFMARLDKSVANDSMRVSNEEYAEMKLSLASSVEEINFLKKENAKLLEELNQEKMQKKSLQAAINSPPAGGSWPLSPINSDKRQTPVIDKMAPSKLPGSGTIANSGSGSRMAFTDRALISRIRILEFQLELRGKPEPEQIALLKGVIKENGPEDIRQFSYAELSRLSCDPSDRKKRVDYGGLDMWVGARARRKRRASMMSSGSFNKGNRGAGNRGAALPKLDIQALRDQVEAINQKSKRRKRRHGVIFEKSLF